MTSAGFRFCAALTHRLRSKSLQAAELLRCECVWREQKSHCSLKKLSKPHGRSIKPNAGMDFRVTPLKQVDDKGGIEGTSQRSEGVSQGRAG
jgi:hypothetical protein